MSRIIRDHRVFGKEVLVMARTEAEAIRSVKKRTSLHIWEIKQIAAQFWEAYVAEHDRCFALND